MYVSTGLSGYRPRRGLGLNCPGDPGCPGNVQPTTPTSPDVQQQIADLWDSVFQIQVAPAATFPTTMSSWLTTNGSKIAIGAGVFLGTVFLMKAMR